MQGTVISLVTTGNGLARIITPLWGELHETCSPHPQLTANTHTRPLPLHPTHGKSFVPTKLSTEYMHDSDTFQVLILEPCTNYPQLLRMSSYTLQSYNIGYFLQ